MILEKKSDKYSCLHKLGHCTVVIQYCLTRSGIKNRKLSTEDYGHNIESRILGLKHEPRLSEVAPGKKYTLYWTINKNM
jgi:hypothetical protein